MLSSHEMPQFSGNINNSPRREAFRLFKQRVTQSFEINQVNVNRMMLSLVLMNCDLESNKSKLACFFGLTSLIIFGKKFQL